MRRGERLDDKRRDRIEKAVRANQMTTTEIGRAFGVAPALVKRLGAKHGWPEPYGSFKKVPK